MKIEIIAGSPRPDSLTKRLALHLENILKKHAELEVGLIDVQEQALPYVQKVFATPQDVPEPYRELAERMFSADAFIIVTPEYNGSYSPAMQNLFDHFPKQHHRVFALATASPGALGGLRAAMQLQQFVLALFGIVSPYMLITPQVDKKLDREGNLLDDSFAKNIDTFIREFLWLAERLAVEKMTVV